MRRPLPLLLVLLLAVALPGCAFLKNLLSAFKRPELHFKTANVRNASLSGATLDLVYTLQNPNPVGLKLDRIVYNLEIEGHPVVAGSPPRGLAMKSKGSTDLTFPAEVQFRQLAPALEAFLTKDTATYKASGEIGVETPIGLLSFPLEKTGTFPVPKMPQLQLDPPKVSNVSFSGARVTFPVRITNKNGFPLPLAGFNANVSIAGTTVGSSAVNTPALLAAGETQTVELPLDVNFLSAGRAVASVVQGGSAQVKLDGKLASGAESLPVTLLENVVFKR